MAYGRLPRRFCLVHEQQTRKRKALAIANQQTERQSKQQMKTTKKRRKINRRVRSNERYLAEMIAYSTHLKYNITIISLFPLKIAKKLSPNVRATSGELSCFSFCAQWVFFVCL